MRRRLSRSAVLVASMFLVVGLGGACSHTQNHQTPQINGRLSEPTSGTRPSPNEDGRITTAPTPDSALSEETAMILKVENDVTLKRQGLQSFVPIHDHDLFSFGDVLQIGSASSAQILCTDRGVCILGIGTYTACCTPACSMQVQMMRAGEPDSGAVISKVELKPADANALNDAEAKIRNLGLGQVTTQFLIANLYSNWRLQEANQELDRLSVQLANPEAKQELKAWYAPVTRKTADMHLRYNRFEDAKKLYLMNISNTNDQKDKAASHVGLAQAYTQTGDNTQAVQNFEAAKDIYLRQGDAKSATITEKQITNIRTMQPVDRKKIFTAPSSSP